MKSIANRIGAACLLASLLLAHAAYADTAHVAEDAHIDLGNPEEAIGTVPNLVVSNIVDRKTGERLAFVSYELAELPEGASLEQAWLRLFISKVTAPGDIDLYLVTEPWEEHGISGATAPGFEALPFTTFSIFSGDEGHFVAIDVTPEVQAWLQGYEPNYGFVFRGNPGTDVEVSIDSKENSQTSHQSELELVLGTATGGVDSDDIADDSITSADILDGTLGGADVDKDQVQLRVTGTCAAGSSIRAIGNMGGVVCEPDDDSGGDITSVFPSAGGGLAGGAGSGDAELGIAPGGVTSAMVADGSIGSADVNSAQVQLRVGGTCPPGSSIRTIAPNGSVQCEEDTDTDSTLDPDLFWQLDGNAGTSPIPGGSDFLGTTDDTELALGVNGTQGLRLSYQANADFETIKVLGGHPVNRVTAIGGTVAGGGALENASGDTHPNKVEGIFGAIGGGWDNSVLDRFGFIGGGDNNLIGPSPGASGYNKNSAIAGGHSNSIEVGPSGGIDFAGDSFIGGGFENRIVGAGYSSIVGGIHNEIHSIERSFIGGGESNKICDPETFTNIPSFAEHDAILGGENNETCGGNAAIVGGRHNFASGRHSTVLGGYFNEALGDRSMAGGSVSKASGFVSVALGLWANADHRGAFVWGGGGDGTSPFPADTVHSERDNQFRIRAHGGARFDVGDDAGTASGGDQWVDIRTQALNTLGSGGGGSDFRLIDTSTGAYLSLGGGWVSSSDRERKTDVRDIDADWILEQVAALPLQSWRYKVEDESIRHIGPMAQDFQAAFGLGGNPKGIMSVDADGVALAAIQALYKITAELERRTQQLEAQQHRMDTLEAGLQALEARLSPFADQRLVRADVNPGSD